MNPLRFFARFRRTRKDDLRQEMEAHLQMAVADRVARGESPEAARQSALREFGNVPLVADVTHDSWAWTRVERLAQDLRYAVRQIRRSPAFAATVIGTLALGIAAATAMFTVVNRLLIQPTPYPDQGRLVLIAKNNGKQIFGLPPTWSDVQQWIQQSHSFQALAYWTSMDGNTYLEARTASPRVLGLRVSPNLFQTLGVQPLIGRSFSTQSSTADAGLRPLILSNALWQQSFGGDKSILGTTVRINDVLYTVIGVMPPGFRFPIGSQTLPQVWTPIRPTTDDPTHRKGDFHWVGTYYAVIARLNPGVSLQAAKAEMDLIQQRVASQYKDANARRDQSTVRLQLYSNSLVQPNTRKALLALLAASGILWLIAVVNAANLFLARMISRRREIATRGALGASRARVVQQLLAEGLLLSTAAGSLGSLLAFASIRLLAHELHNQMPLPVPATPDFQILLSLLAMTILSAALSTGLPAWFASRTPIEPALRQSGLQSGTSRRDHRSGGALIAVEVALSLALLVSCGLLLRTIYALRSVPLGFRTNHILVASLSIPAYRFSGRNMTADLYEPLLDRACHLHGIESAGLMSDVPLSHTFIMTFTMSGDTNGWGSYLKAVTPGIRQVFGERLVAGRYFDAQDTPSSLPVAVVNQAFARMHSPDPGNPKAILGTGLLDFRKNVPARVVGILADEHQGGISAPAVPEVDISLRQLTPQTDYYEFVEGTSMQLVLRTSRPPAQVIPELRDILGHASPELRNATITTMDQIVEDSYGSQRLAAHLLEIFGGSALLLCVAGIYGLLAYIVTQRTREMGLRIALGARRGDLLWLVLRQAGILLLLGVAAGTALAFAATRVIHGFLYGVHPHDAWSFAAAALLLLTSGLLAAYLPARRAAHTDPMQALRAE